MEAPVASCFHRYWQWQLLRGFRFGDKSWRLPVSAAEWTWHRNGSDGRRATAPLMRLSRGDSWQWSCLSSCYTPDSDSDYINSAGRWIIRARVRRYFSDSEAHFFTGRLATANRSLVSILVTTILARAGGVVDPAKIFVVSLLQFLQFRKAPTVLKSYQKENELTYRARFQFNGHIRSSTFQSSP